MDTDPSEASRLAIQKHRADLPDSLVSFMSIRGYSPELVEAAAKCWKEMRRYVSPTGESWGNEINAVQPKKMTLEKSKAVTA